jgi:hypothetical protein
LEGNQPAKNEDFSWLTILTLARELCLQFHVGPLPERIWWTTPSPTVRFRSDEAWFFNRQPVVTLSQGLDGRLTLDDWKPLMMASLIYSKVWRYRLSSRMTFLLVATGVGIIFLTFLILAITGQVITSYLLAGSVVLLILGTPWGRRPMRFEADRKVAETLGKESLINALKKIQSLHLKDIERSKQASFFSRLFSSRVSLEERLFYLQTLNLS